MPRVVKRKMSKFLVKRKAHHHVSQTLPRPAAEAVVITGASKTHGCRRSRADPNAEAAQSHGCGPD
jgi:hypothetical protein